MGKKYFYILRNSYKEHNQTVLSFLFSLLALLAELGGLLLFYSFLAKPQGTDFVISNDLIVYFLFILAVSSASEFNFSVDVRQEIKTEGYVRLNKMPLDPFFYFFFKSIGRNVKLFALVNIGAMIYLGFIGFPILGMVLFIPAVLLAIILMELIYFCILNIIFYLETFSIYMIFPIFDFLSGRLIPLHMMPKFLQSNILGLLPFIYASGGIARNFSTYSTSGIVQSLVISLIWSVIIFILGKHFWNKGSFAFQEH